MATLGADITRIADYENVCFDEDKQVSAVTQLLISIGDVIGTPLLNHETIDTWLLRIKMLKFSNTDMAYKNGSAWWPSEHHLRKHIGLVVHTKNLTQTEFDQWIINVLKQRANTHQLVSNYH